MDQRKGFVMSADAVRALCHTLIAAKYRVNRLIREREAYKKAYEDLCNQTSTVVGNPLQVHCEHQVPKGEEKPKIDADQ